MTERSSQHSFQQRSRMVIQNEDNLQFWTKLNSVFQLQAFPNYGFIQFTIKIIYVGLSKQTLNQVFTHHSHYKLSIASIGTEWLWWHVRKFCRRICLMVLRQLGKRKDSACNAGDPGLISGSGRFPGEGDSYLLYSCLENPRDRGAWRVIGSHRVGHD